MPKLKLSDFFSVVFLIWFAVVTILLTKRIKKNKAKKPTKLATVQSCATNIINEKTREHDRTYTFDYNESTYNGIDRITNYHHYCDKTSFYITFDPNDPTTSKKATIEEQTLENTNGLFISSIIFGILSVVALIFSVWVRVE